MENNLYHWKSSFGSSDSHLFKGIQKLGTLHNSSLDQRAVATMESGVWTFETKGITTPYTQILNNDRQPIGTIDFSSWTNRASVTLGIRHYQWRAVNWLGTKWELTDNQGNRYEMTSDLSGGVIYGNIEDELLLLIGLFLRNYYWQYGLLVFAIVFTTMSIVML